MDCTFNQTKLLYSRILKQARNTQNNENNIFNNFYKVYLNASPLFLSMGRQKVLLAGKGETC